MLAAARVVPAVPGRPGAAVPMQRLEAVAAAEPVAALETEPAERPARAELPGTAKPVAQVEVADSQALAARAALLEWAVPTEARARAERSMEGAVAAPAETPVGATSWRTVANRIPRGRLPQPCSTGERRRSS